jgi:hypothetical protein
VELATLTRPWEAWLLRGMLIERGIPALVDDAGMDNPYRTAAGVERVYVSAGDPEWAREVMAEAEHERADERPRAEPELPSWGVIAVGGHVGAVLTAFLPHGVRFLALIVLITMALPWLLLKGRTGPAPPGRGDRESGKDRQREELP